MIGALNAGVQTIASAQQSLNVNAQDIAKQTVQPITTPGSTQSPVGGQQNTARPVTQATSAAESGLEERLLEQSELRYQIQAGASVIQTSNNTLGSLLDVFA